MGQVDVSGANLLGKTVIDTIDDLTGDLRTINRQREAHKAIIESDFYQKERIFIEEMNFKDQSSLMLEFQRILHECK